MHKLQQPTLGDIRAAIIVVFACLLQVSQGINLKGLILQQHNESIHYTITSDDMLKEREEIQSQEKLNPFVKERSSQYLLNLNHDKREQTTEENPHKTTIIPQPLSKPDPIKNKLIVYPSPKNQPQPKNQNEILISNINYDKRQQTTEENPVSSYIKPEKIDKPISFHKTRNVVTTNQDKKTTFGRFIPPIYVKKSKFKVPRKVFNVFNTSTNRIAPINEVKPAQPLNKIKSLKQMKALTDIQTKSYQKQKYYRKILAKVKISPLKNAIEIKNSIKKDDSKKPPNFLPLKQNENINIHEEKLNGKLDETIEYKPLKESDVKVISKDLLTEHPQEVKYTFHTDDPSIADSSKLNSSLENKTEHPQEGKYTIHTDDPSIADSSKLNSSLENKYSEADIQQDASYQADIPVLDKLATTIPTPIESRLINSKTPPENKTAVSTQPLSKPDIQHNANYQADIPVLDELGTTIPTLIEARLINSKTPPEHKSTVIPQPLSKPDPMESKLIIHPPPKDQPQPNNQNEILVSKYNNEIIESGRQRQPAPNNNYIPAYTGHNPSYYYPQYSMKYPNYYNPHLLNSDQYYHQYTMWTCQFYPYCCWDLLAPMYYQSYCCCVTVWMCPYYNYKQPSSEDLSALTTVPPATVPQIRVNVTVFITATCPFALSFLKNNAQPMMEILSDHVNFQMIPHGKVTNENEVTCKLNMMDCLSNKYILCVMQQISDQKKQLEYAVCLMDLVQVLTAVNVHNLAVQCGDGHGLIWPSVEYCVTGSEGEQLLMNTDMIKKRFMGDEHLYTPTVYIEQKELWDYRKVQLAVCLSLKIKGEISQHC